MCMLCVIPPHVIPNLDYMDEAAYNNPHGFGFAIAVPSEQRIIVEKSMDATENILRFLELRTQYPEGYALWHARYATHGAKNVDNCHPFQVGKDTQTYLAHNGILDVHIPKMDDRSDTRVFAEELLPAIGGVTALDNEWVWDMMEEYTSGSKVAVLSVNPDAQHQLYLLNRAAGWEGEDGVWWSNTSCFPYSSTWTSKDKDFDDEFGIGSSWSKDEAVETEGEEIYQCLNESCMAVLTEAEVIGRMECGFCGYCFQCESKFEECDCYIPPTRRAADKDSALLPF